MTIIFWLIPIFWLVFIVYWFISAMQSKRTLRGPNWWYGALVRIVLLIILILALHTDSAQNLVAAYQAASTNFSADIIGTILCGLGIAFAIWARVHLGRNWGMPMSIKENPELVTTGPYRFVRNPIYTGMLLAILGTALANNLIWLVAFVFALVYFMYSAKKEEQIMAREFPNTYPEYKKRTKMLVPFVW